MAAATALPSRLRIGDLDFAVRESEQRRTVGITVDRDGSLLLHAPAGADQDALTAWARSKRGWVFRKLAEKHLLLPSSPAKDFVVGEGFDYLGRHYRRRLTDDPAGAVVKLERGRLRMPRAAAESGGGKSAMTRNVIVHELAHVGQPRHTPTFWAAVQRAFPDYDHRRTRLATTGTTLWLG
jgi:predicted metal-dependent hydrolase